MFEGDNPEMFDEMTEERKTYLLNWIDENLFPIEGFNEKHSSYGIKHLIRGEYFTNGEFKGAMKASGYRIQNEAKQNWVFNVSQKSPAFHQDRG